MVGRKIGLMGCTALLASAMVIPTADYAIAGSSAKGGNAKVEQKSAVQNQKELANPNVQKELDKLLRPDVQGAIAYVYDHGKYQGYASGIADVNTGRKMEADYRYRIGSLTKTFIATVVLQLAGENKLNLDDPVEKWVPGLVQGNGYDGNKVTIRQLLNHTSGLNDYSMDLFDGSGADILKRIQVTYSPEELVKKGLKNDPLFEPGKGLMYTNTNYVLLGIIVEKVTGSTYAQQIEKRIIEPLKLNNTFCPGVNLVVPGANHSKAYLYHNNERFDVTDLNPSIAGASGEMISSGRDLSTFFSALFGGKLLKPEQMKQMFTTVKSGYDEVPYFGLGIYQMKMPNGELVWGHSGGIFGSVNGVRASRDGQRVVVVNMNVYTESTGGEEYFNGVYMAGLGLKKK
ncbi:beta-lactamase family protein [Paenibacillus donghaensis]|uniref:serine hydrolase domain-containing protein n=1 Tax=Paenibacillus donghaensis TaxID=414771 RepID=UPI001884800C|nr:serine hydrolase domain-containing protein [Paenibacillus donghaensis]MBE9914921.1 beta-lactamase family protein [Paenibacillus donghaensis]